MDVGRPFLAGFAAGALLSLIASTPTAANAQPALVQEQEAAQSGCDLNLARVRERNTVLMSGDALFRERVIANASDRERARAIVDAAWSELPVSVRPALRKIEAELEQKLNAIGPTQAAECPGELARAFATLGQARLISRARRTIVATRMGGAIPADDDLDR